MQNEQKKYYVVTQNAIPEVLLKVVEVKRLLEGKNPPSVIEATDQVGISRSSFYKYKDDIFEFHENVRGKTITFLIEMRDEPGLLSDVLMIVARSRANILTIHQSIPVSGMASTSISVQVMPETGDVTEMMDQIDAMDGVKSLRILGAE
ncbi:MAG: ACT domain-containing protein [Lachnospiraceae bacterium]|jgi:chorismate mutase|uniref:ACT domain-containing protein n=1 Tax=Porcincola sp. LCP21S3_C12 TaxID=3438798 RepID=UPI0029774ACF|nr:ACT domain-containing protein [Lachnospiraceae bacterium]